MKLSELGQQKVQVISEPQPAKQEASQPQAATSLKLSEINPEAVSVIAQPQSSAETELDQLKKRTESWLKYPVEIGRQIDRFTGAPVRAAIGAFQDDKSAGSAFIDQFSKQPEEAPTGKEIAVKAGFSADESLSIPGLKIPRATDKGIALDDATFSPAGAAGLGVDVVADWSNVVPVGAVAKGITKATGYAGKPIGLGMKMAANTTDMVTGTKGATKALEYTAEKGKAIKLAFSDLFNPRQADDYPDLVRIAQKNGINESFLPEAIEFGPNSVVTRSARVRAEGPLGQGQLEKFTEGLQQTKNAATGVIKNISGGTIISKVEAGGVIRKGYDNAVARLFNGMDDTYNKISARNPGLRLNEGSTENLYGTLSDLETFAKSRLSRGVTSQQKNQANQLLSAIQAVRSTGAPAVGVGPPGAPTMQGIIEVMRNTGEAAFKKGSGISLDPPDIERLRKLYGEMRDAVVDTIQTSVPNGNTVAAKLRENNKAISEFMSDSSILSRTIKDDISDEAIFSRLVEQGDTKKIESLAKVLSPQELQEVKGAFLESLLARNMDDDFTFKSTINRMKPKQAVMESLFSPEEIKEFTDVLRLGDRFGQPIMSTSGTGASNVFKNITQGVKDSVINDSFINSLKQRARGSKGGEPIKYNFSGALNNEPIPGQVNSFTNTKTLLNNLVPSGTELRLKGSRVLSTQDIEANDGRKEAMRRRILTRGNN